MPKKNLLDRPLLRMLKCLDRKQLKGFHAYLNCELFNTNPTIAHLFTYLETEVMGTDQGPAQEAALLERLEISASTCNKLFSQLLSLLNRFMAYWETRNSVLPEFSATFTGWHRIGLEVDLLEKEYQKMKRKLPESAASNADLLHELQLENSYAVMKVNQPRRGNWEFFDRHLQLLESYYWVTRLKYLCAAISAGRVFNSSDDLAKVELEAAQVAALPLIGFSYYTAYQLLEASVPGLPQVREFFEFLEKHGVAFATEDRSDLYGYLLNSCFRTMAQGEIGTEELVNAIYDAMLRHGLLTELGYISSGHFKNIVSIKTRLGLIVEAREFIAANQHLLEDAVRESLIAFTEGIVAFYAEEFPLAAKKFRQLLQASNEDLMWTLEARKMLWKSYFEMYEQLSAEEHTEMHRLYHSFRVYVSRNSNISAYHKTGYENFIRLFNRLIQVGDEAMWASTVPELEALHAEAAEMEKIVHKKWLLNAIQKRIRQKRGG